MGCVRPEFDSRLPDKMNKIKILLLAFGLTFTAAAIGSAAATPSIPIWYTSLNKPSFDPPNWTFGPVWTILYFLMATSFYLVLATKGVKENRIAKQLYLAQLLLNILWPITFFSFKNIGLAFVESLVLWMFIVITMISFYKINKKAAYLFLPYLLWVSFVSFLNLNVFFLN